MCPEASEQAKPVSSEDWHTDVHSFTSLLRVQLLFCIATLVHAAIKTVSAGQESTKTLTESPDAARQEKVLLLAKETNGVVPVLTMLAIFS